MRDRPRHGVAGPATSADTDFLLATHGWAWIDGYQPNAAWDAVARVADLSELAVQIQPVTATADGIREPYIFADAHTMLVKR